MRIMYDSVSPQAIPRDADMVAGYIDGTTGRWSASDWNRFPHARKVRIARRTHTNDGHVLDVEAGIPTVWPINNGIVDWVRMRRKAGIVPAIYCNQLNDWGPIRQLFERADVAQPLYWVARYNGDTRIPTGAIAKQFANASMSDGHYDRSSVHNYWPSVDPIPRKDFLMALTDAEQEDLYRKVKYVFTVLDSPADWSVQNWNLGQVLSLMRTYDVGLGAPGETLHDKVSKLADDFAALKTYIEGLQ